jgi:uncharacterized membrane protein
MITGPVSGCLDNASKKAGDALILFTHSVKVLGASFEMIPGISVRLSTSAIAFSFKQGALTCPLSYSHFGRFRWI